MLLVLSRVPAIHQSMKQTVLTFTPRKDSLAYRRLLVNWKALIRAIK